MTPQLPPEIWQIILRHRRNLMALETIKRAKRFAEKYGRVCFDLIYIPREIWEITGQPGREFIYANIVFYMSPLYNIPSIFVRGSGYMRTMRSVSN